MYQREVDVDMLNAVKSLLADVSSVRPSSERQALRLFAVANARRKRRSAYPHQPHVDTFCVLPLRRRRLKRVLTGTSILLYTVQEAASLLVLSVESAKMATPPGNDVNDNMFTF